MAPTRSDCPYENASVLSKFTYSWIYDILIAGVRGRLKEETIYNPPSWARAEHREAKFQRYWNLQRGRRWGLMRCVVSCFWKPIILAWTGLFITDMMRITQPVLVGALVRYMSGSKDITDTTAYLLVAAIAPLSMLIASLFEISNYVLYTTSMNLRTSCATLIFKKVTTLSSRARQEITSGHIVTLMATDIESFHLAFVCAHAIFTAPVILIIIGLLGGFEIGVAITSGMAVIILFVLLRLFTGVIQGRLKSAESSWTDKRVHLMGEIITAMRVVKMYCWEKPFVARIKALRRLETSVLMKSVQLQYLSMATSYLMGNITSFISLCVYVALGNRLTPEIAVKLIGWMKALDMTIYVTLTMGISTFSEMVIALRRIQNFLNADDLVASDFEKQTTLPGVTFVDVSATWGVNDRQSSAETGTQLPYTLRKMSFAVSSGQLIAVVGAVGAGKTSVLRAILKELAISDGELHVNGSVAYVPQESWILSDTVRYNILINNDMDAQKYKTIVNACALDVDIENFPDGDLTLVGERGLSLSGGQKARINMARAMYHDADIFLLDDPLSAVDTRVGNIIFNKCICGVLRSKTRILVTHQHQYLKYVDKVIVMNEGRIISMGSYESVACDLDVFVKTPEDAMSELELERAIAVQHRKTTSQRPAMTQRHSTTSHNAVNRGRSMSTDGQHPLVSSTDSKGVGTSLGNPALGREISDQESGPEDDDTESKEDSLKEKLLKPSKTKSKTVAKHVGYGAITEKSNRKTTDRSESNKTGSVSHSVYFRYFKAGYGIILGPIVLLLLCVKMVLDVGSDWMMSNWGADHPLLGHERTFLDDPDVFLKTLSLLLLGFVVIFMVESAIIGFLLVTASRRLYTGMFDRVVRTPMVFFERRPVGQILNRFSRDTGFMDHMIPYSFFWVVENPSRALAYAIYSTVIFPWMAIAIVLCIVLFGLLGYVMLKCLRELKRIEAQLRSPMYSSLSTMLEGIEVIRAHNLQNYFLEESKNCMDRHTSVWFLFLTTNRYLAFTVEMILAVLTVFYMAITVALNTDETKAGSLGLSFIYFFYMAVPIQYTIQSVADIDLAMTSVERILQYCQLDQEAPEHTDLTPPNGWPRNGKMVYSDVSLMYAENDTPALGPLTVHINAGEKVGIVGRTGAGKSSFFTSLLRMVEPTGTIHIDDIDVIKMGLSDLRSKISVIPQDPMLFSGPLRMNLDPFSEYDDGRLWNVLSQVQLSKKAKELELGLETEMGESGSSFSVGQRQLLCMARALLKNNKIIIIDEATANVDYRTDSAIQRTIASKFSNCTVLTIAHRLATIITYNKIMVLDHGRLVQFGHPHVLLQDTEGPFHQMVHQMVPTQARHLEITAETSYRRQLAIDSEKNGETRDQRHVQENGGITNMGFSDV